MKSLILCGWLALLLLVSCKKDKDDKPAEGGTKLTKMVSISGSTTTTTSLSYDANGKLAGWRQTESGNNNSDMGFRIQRKADGMIDRIIFKMSYNPDSSTLVVSSSGTQYTKAEWTQTVFGSTEARRTSFTYDNAGNIVESTITDIHGNGQHDPKSRVTYTYANGNISSIKVYRISGGTNDLFVQYDLAYDQKPNPRAFGVEWTVLTATEMLFAAEGSANNFTQITVKQNGTPERPFFVTYTYNNHNMPVTAVQKDANGQVVATITYTYE